MRIAHAQSKNYPFLTKKQDGGHQLCVCVCARSLEVAFLNRFSPNLFRRSESRIVGSLLFLVIFGIQLPIFCACAVRIYIENASKHVKSASNQLMSVTNHKTDVLRDAQSASKCLMHMPNPKITHFLTKKQDGGVQIY